MHKRVLISSTDNEENSKLASFFEDRDYDVIIDRPGSRTIYDSMKKDLGFMFCEIGSSFDTAVDMIELIKELKPTLPIVTFSRSCSLEEMRKIHELSVYYALFKPLQVGEVESIVDALEQSYRHKRNIH